MSKKMGCLIAATLLAAAATCASDAWKDKDFQNWDLKDVQKILSDSPWSKKLQTGGGPSPRAGGMRGGGAGPGMTQAGGVSGTPSSSASRGDGGASAPNSTQQPDLTITWYSSRTIREATAREKELEGTSAEDARKDLSAESTAYEVAVSGRDLGALGTDVERLKEHSYLMSKMTKEKLTPENVAIQREKGKVLPTAIIFRFAKTSASGEPAIGKNEKGVVFFTQAGGTDVKVTFDLSKMMDKLGADY
jgi:hypothetical protein